MPLSIAMCICRQTPFEQLLPLARTHGWTLEELVRQTGCGGNCGLCRPYLKRMLQTGQTVFSEIITE